MLLKEGDLLMNINDTMHKAQVAILHALLFRPAAGFTELQKASELSSDHFTFHLSKMIEQGLVHKKDNGDYTLTLSGKEYANRFDTDARVVERQPKVAVCLMIRDPQDKQLVQQRLKQPYYGYWGRPTGKIRWGEAVLEAAARELKEETGLEADLVFEQVYHKRDYNKEAGELLEDKLFFVIGCNNIQGELIETFEGGRNAWMTQEEYVGQELSFEGATAGLSDSERHPAVAIVEARHEYSPQQY
jgi:ADP-ribose pyrophosphatase YjhB (NUDIX family)/predicted transcriptional regulator